jgi:hypothetical protein
MSDRWAALGLIAVAVLVAVQVGVIRVRRDEASALRRRLGDVQARCESAELGLKKELAATRVRLDWLQRVLDRKGGEAQRMRRELAAARQALGLLQASASDTQARLDDLHGAIDGASGALRVELVANGDLGQLVAMVSNASSQPVDVLQIAGLMWLGGRSDGSGYSAQGSELAAGSTTELFRYELFADEPELVRSGAESLRVALCLVWQPSPDSAEWLDTYWFEYRQDREELELVRRDGAPLVDLARGCDLESAAPPW